MYADAPAFAARVAATVVKNRHVKITGSAGLADLIFLSMAMPWVPGIEISTIAISQSSPDDITSASLALSVSPKKAVEYSPHIMSTVARRIWV